MSLSREDLYEAFLAPFGGRVAGVSGYGTKPLEIDLRPPAPPRLRVYLYNLVDGGRTRPYEFKIVLRVPGQRGREQREFDQTGGRMVVLAGYSEELDTFALWDAGLHFRFKDGDNVQVKKKVVVDAADCGYLEQSRDVALGSERILVARSDHLVDALWRRVVLAERVDLFADG